MKHSSVIRVFQTFVNRFDQEAILACTMIACLLMSGIAHAQGSTILDRLYQSSPQSAELVEVHINQREENSSGGAVEISYHFEEIPDVRDLIQNLENVTSIPNQKYLMIQSEDVFYRIQWDEGDTLRVIKFPQGSPTMGVCCKMRFDWCCTEYGLE